MEPRDPTLAERVRTASGDMWELEGRLRASRGGGIAQVRDMRLMSSGLGLPSWNTADVTGPAPDLEAARSFYAERGVPWGLRVPAGMPWSRGRHELRQRHMGLPACPLGRAPEVPGLELRPSDHGDRDTVVEIDAAAFEEDPAVSRPWIEPHFEAARVQGVLASVGGRAIGTAFTWRSDRQAGPCLYLGGVAVLESARGRGVAAAMSVWLLERGFAAGAELAHLHADSDLAARVYARLGFVDAGELDVYVDV